MKHKKIMLIGCGGSGKSTLAIQIGKKLDIPVTHLDKLLWRDNWEQVSKEEFDFLLTEEFKKESWIIDGNYDRTIPMRLEECDTVIYLDFPRITCLIGAIRRVIFNYGKTRPDMGGNCPEHFDAEFLKWIWNFNKKNRLNYINMLNNSTNKNIYILHRRKECKELLSRF